MKVKRTFRILIPCKFCIGNAVFYNHFITQNYTLNYTLKLHLCNTKHHKVYNHISFTRLMRFTIKFAKETYEIS